MALWSDLHRDARYRPRWPSEHVVRWLSRLDGHGLALDIGAGAGRHTKLLSEFGYTAVATDISLTGLRCCYLMDDGDTYMQHACAQATCDALPFKDESFDVALAYAVAYYSDRYWEAIRELHRVLKPGGHGFMTLRTPEDDAPSRGEGMPHALVTEHALPSLFFPFSSFAYERCDTTRNERRELDSEWLISLTR